jgi:DNA-binding response OmpR family regulator
MATGLPQAPAGPVVLIVDEDADLRFTLAALLESSGFQVHTARTTDEAAGCVGSQNLHAIISDVRVGGQDAVQLCQGFRRSGAKSLLIAHTGWVSGEMKRKAREAGFDAFVPKPAAPEALIRLLASAANLARADLPAPFD